MSALAFAHRSAVAPPAIGEDRWLLGVHAVHARRFSAATAAVLGLSVLMHAAVISTALLGDRIRQDHPTEEIPVEVVQEMPKPPEPPPPEKGKAAEGPDLALKKTLPADDAPKPVPPQEQPKAAAEKTPEPSPPPAPEKSRIDEARAQAEEARAQEQARAQAEAEEAKAQEARAQEARAHEAAELESLQDELAKLRQEHAALEAEPKETPSPQSAKLAAAGLGPLAGSLQAVALPGASMESGEAVGYEAIVFSQLAKAKAIGGQMGVPGSAGVRFAIGDDGALLDVELVKSSGVKKLDDEALSIVRKAAPFPVPPEGAQRRFSANVSFVGEPRP